MAQPTDLMRQHPSRSPRRPVALFATTTAIGSSGLAAGGTAGAMLAAEMTGTPAAAGLPLGAHVAGSAVGALLIARVSAGAGRAAGLIAGYVLGAAGAGLVIVGAVVADFAVVLTGSAVLGVANAAVFLTRYAAAEIAGEAARGRALGTVLFAAATGAVVSPNLLGPSGEFAASLGLPPLTGLYLVAVVSFVTAGLLLAVVRRMSAGESAGPRPAGRPERAVAVTRAGAVRRALVVLAVANLVMTSMMAVAPVHLSAHGHGLGPVGGIVSLHVLCMFLPAPLAGWLVDRTGPAPLAGAGAALLVAAGVAGTTADPHSAVAFMVVLALLGLGWSAGIVAGSTMLMAAVSPDGRLRAEGAGEVVMGLAAGIGTPIAGVVVAVSGFPAVAVAAAGVVLAVLVAAPLIGAVSRGRARR